MRIFNIEQVKRKDNKNKVRSNREIYAKEVRVIGTDGEAIGVMHIDKALTAASKAGLDLVEISPNARPPVCKIIDYGKYMYEQQKRKSEAKKKQKQVQTKEVKVTLTTSDHDLQIKGNKAIKFLEAGNKVKVSLRYRGREARNIELGVEKLNKFASLLGATIGVKKEVAPKLEGRNAFMILVSDKANPDGIKPTEDEQEQES